MPGVVKALDRLVGASIDIPVAWLTQKKARIDAQTESYRLVETAIAQAVASGAAADPDTIQRAMSFLINKEYRKQLNREAVATAMVESMHVPSETTGESTLDPKGSVDQDWMNILERFAEDASSEHLQKLWGRVLAGEIRRPGRFSARTLRFLSEFSQADALTFERFAKNAFGDIAPKGLILSAEHNDVRNLLYLESSGIIYGISSVNLVHNIMFDGNGYAFLAEDDLRVVFKGKPKSSLSSDAITLTPLGQELLCLVASRNPRDAAKAVAFALRREEIHEAHLGVSTGRNTIRRDEVLW